MADSADKDKTQKHRVACTGCRRIKVRCLILTETSSNYDVCKRCVRLKLECVYETNKRGRKTAEHCPPVIVKATQPFSAQHASTPTTHQNKKPRHSSPPREEAGPSSPRSNRSSSSSPDHALMDKIWDTVARDHQSKTPPPHSQPVPSPIPNEPSSFLFPLPSYTGNQSPFAPQPPSSALPSPSTWSLPFPQPQQSSPQPLYPPVSTLISQPSQPFATSLLSFPHPALATQRPSSSSIHAYSSPRIDPTTFFRPESYLRGPSPNSSGLSAISPSKSTSGPPHGVRSRSGDGKGGGALSVVDLLSSGLEPAAAETPRDVEMGGIDELEELDDPIRRGLLLHEDVAPLFTTFLTRFNCMSCQLDPHLHTAAFCQRSPVLFTAVLCAASKVERPDLYEGLKTHANALVVKGFAEDLVTVEFISAISILAYWKPSVDSSAWRRLGYAIRLAIELDLHLQQKRPLPEDEIEARLIVNRERVWIQLIAFDRTLFFQQGRPRMIDTSLEPDMDEWSRNHDSVFTLEDSVLISATESLKLHMVSMSCRKAVDLDLKRMLMDHQIAIFARWKKEWTGDRPKLPFSPLGIISIRFFSVLFEFELAALRLSLVTRTPAPNSKSLAPDPGAGGAPYSFVGRLNEESILAFDGAVRASMAVVRYFNENMGDTLAFAQDTVLIGLASASIFLARNISRVPRKEEITELLKCAAHVCRSAAKQPVDAAAYQTRFFLSLLQAMAKNANPLLPSSTFPSRAGSPTVATPATPGAATKKKAPLAPVDFSLLDDQLNGIADPSTSQWTFPSNPSTSFDDMFSDPSNWFPGFEAPSGDVLPTNWGLGDFGTGVVGDWGGVAGITPGFE